MMRKLGAFCKRVAVGAMCFCLALPFCCSVRAQEGTTALTGATTGVEEKPVEPSPGADNAEMREAQEKKLELEGSLAEARRAVRELEASERDAQDKVSELERRLDVLKDQEDRATENLSNLSDRIAESKMGLEEARKQADAQYDGMKERIRFMYENGGYRTLDLIFSSGSIGEMLKAAEYISSIYQYDREMLDAYIGYQKAIKKRTEELENEFDEAQAMKGEIEDRHEAMQVLLAAKNQEVKQLDGELSEAEKVRQEYEQEVAAQNEVLLAISAEIARQAAEEEAKRAAEEARRAEEEARRKAAEEEAKRKAEQASQQTESSEEEDSTAVAASDEVDPTDTVDEADSSNTVDDEEEYYDEEDEEDD